MPSIAGTTLNNTSRLDVKDQLSYEHARWRALKPSDRTDKGAKPYKSKRVSGNVGRSAKYHLNGRVRGRMAPNPVWSGWVAKSDLTLDDDDEYLCDGVQEQDQHFRSIEEPARGNIRINLDELIKPQRKPTGVAREYEFVSCLRPVLVMEDIDIPCDVASLWSDEAGSDWEVIHPDTASSRSMESALPGRSYASVLTSPRVSKL
ncbi:uncharacterized protein EI90DRAFT_3149777 [Cantharellus anzutake]|uniref:uncharacterized protein n=1 Tax=Cantharellus anzutake TaxID=1750568 RepID=UPI0019041D77|nr:uncharacterized protein EI90DRAFT_3149777 [Cantharellus anzutake]KAF8342668.1 hypothetical protein EI90DRAFT_3149777 [Cantharellus anzutake]